MTTKNTIELPEVPKHIIAGIQAYGDARADEDTNGAANVLATLIIELRKAQRQAEQEPAFYAHDETARDFAKGWQGEMRVTTNGGGQYNTPLYTAAPPPAQVPVEPVDYRFGPIAMVLRDVAELDNYYPDTDMTQMLVVSPEQLEMILDRHFAQVPEGWTPVEDGLPELMQSCDWLFPVSDLKRERWMLCGESGLTATVPGTATHWRPAHALPPR